jgi:plastocyanin
VEFRKGDLMQIRYVLAVALLLSAAACSSNDSNSSGAPSSTGTTSGTTTGGTTTGGTTTGATTTVNIPVGASVLTTTAFAPATVTIKVGDSVNWVNNDSIAHTSTATSGAAFNSGIINPGGSFRATFTTAGSFPYHCTIHPGMVGTVTVQ